CSRASSSGSSTPTCARRRSRCWRKSAPRRRCPRSSGPRRVSRRRPSLFSRSKPLPIASAPSHASVAELPPLDEEEFRRLCEFIYRRTGMVFTEAKRYFVERRVLERMAATRSPTFAAYFSRLRGDHEREVEWFVNAFTVNETYFYREDHQLRCLTADLLPALLKTKRRGEPIRIWSVPCSTGEEP